MTSNICHVSELDLFSGGNLQTSILDTKENIYSPLTSLHNCQIIQFHIPGTSDQYIDLNSICLRLKLQLTKADGKPFNSAGTPPDAKADQPGPINNVLHSLFKGLRVSFNNTVVSEINNYNYKSYIDTLLNFSLEQKDSNLLPAGFIKDKPDFLEVITAKDPNTGLQSRKYWSDDSRWFELYGKLNSDVFNTPKLLINGVSLDILLTLDSPEFFLMGSDKVETVVKVLEANLYVKHVVVNPQLHMHNLKLLHSGKKVVYPYKKALIKTFTIPQGLTSIELNNVFNGVLPSNMVVGMVENQSFTGSMEKNPYNFQHFKNNSITFTINGNPVSPSPFEHNFNFISGFARTYAEFLKAIGIFNTDKNCLIEREDFRKGFFLVPFNFSVRPNVEDMVCEEIPKQGSLGLKVKFAAALPDTITLIVYAEQYNEIVIDKNLDVTV